MESQFRKKADGTLSPFLTDEDEASYRAWTAENKERIAAMKATSREALEFMWCMTEWQYERVNKAWGDALDLVSTMRETLTIKDEVIRTARLATVLDHIDDLRVAAAQRANLAAGRLEGVKKRQEDAKEKQAALEKAINDLFDQPEKPGWGWGNKEIANFLAKSFTYEASTIEVAVKRVAATHRKRRKVEQASKYLTR